MLKIFQWENIDTTANFYGNLFVQINVVIFTIFACLYFYQNIYMFLALILPSKKFKPASKNHTYGYVIAARNEENVIKLLIDSIKKQNYDQNLMKIFVVCDNCTDKTAQICRDLDVIVYERFDDKKVGKSYALDFVFKKILEEKHQVDAFIVFDADNLVTKNYTYEMNKAFDSGYEIATSYRNSKNYTKNYLTSGSGLCYLRECIFLHKVRSKFNLSTYVSGTGFLVSYNIIKENNGWVNHLLIEDLEFSTEQMLKNRKITYVHDAIFYDEQPLKFIDSWNQRMRWLKGAYQCFYYYIFRIIARMFSFRFKKNTNRFSLYELGLFFAPIPAISALWLIIYNGFIGSLYLFNEVSFTYFYNTSFKAFINFLTVLFSYGFLISFLLTVTQFKRLRGPWYKKLLYIFTFPFFLLTYTPIVLIAPFKKVKWKVIPHIDQASIDDFN